jgi:HEAT repeat protein
VERRQQARELATELTTHRDAFVRQLGLRALWLIGSRHSLPAFAAALDDPSSPCRGYGILGLQRIGSTGAQEALTRAVSSPHAAVRRQVASMLELGPDSKQLLEQLSRDPSWRVRRRARATLRAGSHPASSDG